MHCFSRRFFWSLVSVSLLTPLCLGFKIHRQKGLFHIMSVCAFCWHFSSCPPQVSGQDQGQSCKLLDSCHFITNITFQGGKSVSKKVCFRMFWFACCWRFSVCCSHVSCQILCKSRFCFLHDNCILILASRGAFSLVETRCESYRSCKSSDTLEFIS